MNMPNVECCVFIVLSRRNGNIELSKGNNLISIWFQLQWPGLLLIAAQWLATVVLTTVTESPLVKLTVRNMRCWQKPQENTPISLYIVDVCRGQTLGNSSMTSKLTGEGDDDAAEVKKIIAIFTYNQSLDMKTKVVQHVPRINLSHLNF